jgi:hypothetical protein
VACYEQNLKRLITSQVLIMDISRVTATLMALSEQGIADEKAAPFSKWCGLGALLGKTY